MATDFGAPSVEKKSSNRTNQRKQIGNQSNNTTKEKIIKSTKISNWIQHNELLLKY